MFNGYLMENGNQNSEFSHKKMPIFHGYVKLPEDNWLVKILSHLLNILNVPPGMTTITLMEWDRITGWCFFFHFPIQLGIS